MLDMGSDLRIALFGGYDIGLPIASPERILVITVDLGKSNWFNGAPETGRAEVLRAQR
ncbi:MAG: hypothetical protein R3E64_04705 [Halioglobus sp.]